MRYSYGHSEEQLTLCSKITYVHNVLLGQQKDIHNICAVKKVLSTKLKRFTI